MSYWGPQQQPYQSPTADDVVISRQLTPTEALKRLQVARRVMLLPIMVPVLAGTAALFVIVAGMLSHWSLGSIFVVAVAITVIFGGAVALGMMLGSDVLRRQARFELGESGILTVTWTPRGGTVSGENLQRSFSYQEIQWVRERDGHVVIKLPMQWHPSQHVLALTPDFVPAAVRQQMAAAGVRVR